MTSSSFHPNVSSLIEGRTAGTRRKAGAGCVVCARSMAMAAMLMRMASTRLLLPSSSSAASLLAAADSGAEFVAARVTLVRLQPGVRAGRVRRSCAGLTLAAEGATVERDTVESEEKNGSDLKATDGQKVVPVLPVDYKDATPLEDEGTSKEKEAGSSDSKAASSSEFEDMDDIEVEKGYKMSRVCDKLIDVFLVEKTKPEEWRILLAFSEEWVKIRPYFFTRCKSQAKAADNPKRKADLLKLARRMKEVDNDMQRHDKLLATIEKSPMELDTIVARHRKDFTGDFFQHLHLLCDASYENLNRREEIVATASKCLAAVEAHDRAIEDDESLSVAQLKFDDILNSPSLEAAAKKIDNLAKNKELDSTLMLLITKAWAAAKESTMMKEEVKDIMFHLYNVARGNMSRLVPKEVRIIRHLLAIEDPRERFAEMTNAFSPGDEIEGKDVDALYTTPENLHKWIQVVLDAFYSNKKGTLIKEAQNLMKPSVIGRLEILKEVLEDQFL